MKKISSSENEMLKQRMFSEYIENFGTLSVSEWFGKFDIFRSLNTLKISDISPPLSSLTKFDIFPASKYFENFDTFLSLSSLGKVDIFLVSE